MVSSIFVKHKHSRWRTITYKPLAMFAVLIVLHVPVNQAMLWIYLYRMLGPHGFIPPTRAALKEHAKVLLDRLHTSGDGYGACGDR